MNACREVKRHVMNKKNEIHFKKYELGSSRWLWVHMKIVIGSLMTVVC